MSNDNRMSRRDWFRLRPHRKEDETGADVLHQTPLTPIVANSMGQSHGPLQPVAHPENHGRLDLATLPPMREAILSEEQVRQLFADIESSASEILLMQRLPNAQRASASGSTSSEQLRTVLQSLLTGSIPRVQIRYQWEHASWIDTLERRDDGVRLVRINHVPAPGRSPR